VTTNTSAAPSARSACPSRIPTSVYVGTGDSDPRQRVPRRWHLENARRRQDVDLAGLAETQQIRAGGGFIHQPDIVYVAAQGHAYRTQSRARRLQDDRRRKTGTRCCFRTTPPAPRTWYLDPANPDVLTGLWQRCAGPGPGVGRAGSGLFKSTDAGEHWTEITRIRVSHRLWGNRDRGLSANRRACGRSSRRLRRRVPVGRQRLDLEAPELRHS